MNTVGLAVNAAGYFGYPGIPDGYRNAGGLLLHAGECHRGIPVLGRRSRPSAAYSQFLCLWNHVCLATIAIVYSHGRSDVPLRNSPTYDKCP